MTEFALHSQEIFPGCDFKAILASLHITGQN
jgi:hypothetical protein